MKYRSEIDGLRAIAVIPVMLFHAGFTMFTGGFIGVDVFFVISGYLITSIIIAELAQGRFSLKRFYERRARRILPALFFVMLCCIPFAWAWMVPSQYQDFSQSLIAIPLFISNMFFWRESGYFAAVAEEKPLLHTWSLGVEEQYYVFFPLMLLFLWRYERNWVLYALIALTLISFGLCEYASRYYHNANFFIMPTRAWELFVGSLCAWVSFTSPPKKHNALSLAGLVLIFYAMLAYDEHLRLPSAYTLVPVAGTALILLYGTAGSWAARLLSFPLFVGIGLISYSAYLWHQPLFAFARIRSVTAPDAMLMLTLFGAALALAYLSWRYVEKPFRTKQHSLLSNTAFLWVFSCIAAIAFIAAGLYGHYSDGRLAYWKANALPHQLQAYNLLEKARQPQRSYDNQDCLFPLRTLHEAARERILACAKKYGPGVAVIGDSHAMDLYDVLALNAEGYPFIVGLSNTCRPHSPVPYCYYDDLRAFLEAQPTLFKAILYEQAGFHLFLDSASKPGERESFSDFPIDKAIPPYKPNLAFIDSVTAYLNTLTPYATVIWLGPRIEPHINPNVIMHFGCGYPYALRENQEHVFHALDKTIQERARNAHFRYISQITQFPVDMKTDFISCDHLYWSDGDHYSAEGESYFGSRLQLRFLLKP